MVICEPLALLVIADGTTLSGPMPSSPSSSVPRLLAGNHQTEVFPALITAAMSTSSPSSSKSASLVGVCASAS